MEKVDLKLHVVINLNVRFKVFQINNCFNGFVGNRCFMTNSIATISIKLGCTKKRDQTLLAHLITINDYYFLTRERERGCYYYDNRNKNML